MSEGAPRPQVPGEAKRLDLRLNRMEPSPGSQRDRDDGWISLGGQVIVCRLFPDPTPASLACPRIIWSSRICFCCSSWG